MQKRILFILCLCATFVAHAQIPDGKGGFIVRAVVINGDTIPYLGLPEVEIFAKRIFKSKRDEELYRRLVHNVRKVYPYAKLAGETYKYYDSILAQEANERKRSQLMKQAEKDIKKQFEKELRNLTVTQGKILVKLLDRETSHSAFNLVKDLRNSFQAYLYQGIGRLFGYNLRTKYDPEGRDRDIETIVRLIEQGILTPIPIKN
ncbi:MAG: DUF4294 domain-containing protein [Bacteroidales bacterium]|jgi:hypothetical protein|nr:DUF4294 domain-containing protein [Bacteroidales bacterium]